MFGKNSVKSKNIIASFLQISPDQKKTKTWNISKIHTILIRQMKHVTGGEV